MGAYGRRNFFLSVRVWGFGRILGFLRFGDFGYILGEWAGLGWAGLDGLAGFSWISSFGRLFSAEDWFSGVCGPRRVHFLGGRKPLFRRVYFGFGDLWPRF